ncbi:hypothetical protein D1007_23111 [Hordeum vulgare]|nr:hypothetical protein D1007_23111 [Hordeum vulgare]
MKTTCYSADFHFPFILFRFQKAGLQNEDLLAKIFEDLRNTGEDHWSPANGSMPQSPQNVDAEDHGDENEDKEIIIVIDSFLIAKWLMYVICIDVLKRK